MNKKRNKEEEEKIVREMLKHLREFPDIPLCYCNYPMVLRENSKDGSKFWGCTQYPKCKKTKNYKEKKLI